MICKACNVWNADALASGPFDGLCTECQRPEQKWPLLGRPACEACGNVATHAPDPGNGGSDCYLCDECYTATPCECCACPPKACEYLGPSAADRAEGGAR